MALDGFARAGALLILQVCSGMRPGELLGLKREDLVAGRRGVNNGNAVIALGRKTGTKAGRAQFIVIHPRNRLQMMIDSKKVRRIANRTKTLGTKARAGDEGRRRRYD